MLPLRFIALIAYAISTAVHAQDLASPEDSQSVQSQASIHSQLAPPPDGFNWQIYRNCAFLRPLSWKGKAKEVFDQKVPQGTYAISPEDFSDTTMFETGFTVQLIVNPMKYAGVKASKAAMIYLKPFFDAHPKEDVLMAEQSQHGDRNITIFRYRDAPKGKTPIIVHKFIIANDVDDSVHAFTFEAPAESWNESWKTFGVPILSKVALLPNIPINP